METLRYWLGFNLVRGIGPIRLRALLDAFGDIRAAWEASRSALEDLGLDRRALRNLLKVRRQVDLDLVAEKVAAKGAHVLTWDHDDYPALLKQLPDSPPVLYVRGELTPADEWAVAIVGTRKATTYGKEVARRLAGELARNGVTVVSGLARGIDGVSHRAALDAGGRTIAVLGCGIDRVYPPEHRKLAADIVEQGALVSDYPLGTPPESKNFPPRNRIISGLSRGVVVVEAGQRSGALITSDFAADQGREVFAVPGNILSPASAGCNRLLRDGAHVVTEARDVLETLQFDHLAEKQVARVALPENALEATLLTALSHEPTHVDELARQANLPVETVSSTLVMMELKGLVRQVGSTQYVTAREERVVYETQSERGDS
jgi:DNA processing protein